jgi:hypothetical protein
MADEHDSWFQPFGFDPGEAAAKAMAAARAQAEALRAQAEQAIRERVAAAERFVEKPIDAVVDGAKKVIKKIEDGASGAAKAVGGIVSPGPKSAPDSGSGPPGSVSGLGGSVGAGGKNNPDDVRAVQAALGIDVDGKCGPGTIGAIKAFQKSIGMGNPDGRVDVGGATSRALAGGGGSQPAAASSLAGTADLGGRIVDGVKDLLGLQTDSGSLAGPEDASPNQEKRDGGADGGQAGGGDGGVDGGADAGTSPDPIFQDIDRPFTVRADDPLEFVNKGNQYLALGVAGHMKTDTLTVNNAEKDAKGRVVRANLLVRTTTERPHWIAGRPIGDEKAVIEQAERLIQEHEERHREIMKTGMRNAVREMRGKTIDEADRILSKWIADVDTKQNALDTREGRIEIIQSAGRMTGARLVPR